MRARGRYPPNVLNGWRKRMNKYIISGVSLLVIAICLLPIVGVIAAAALGTHETLAQLAETVLWRYTWTTLVLMVSVAAGSIVIGTLTA